MYMQQSSRIYVSFSRTADGHNQYVLLPKPQYSAVYTRRCGASAGEVTDTGVGGVKYYAWLKSLM